MRWIFGLLMAATVVALAIVFIPYIWERANFNVSTNDLMAGRIMLGLSAILLLVDLIVISKLVKKHKAKELTGEDNLWGWLIGISLLFLSVLLTSFIALMPTVEWAIVCILIGSFPILLIASLIKMIVDEHKQSRMTNK